MTISAMSYTATVGGVLVTPLDGRAILDESWSPYGQADLTIALPADIDALDPRDDARIVVDVVQRFGGTFSLATITAGEGSSTAAWTAGFPGGGPLSVWTDRYGSPYNAVAMTSRRRRFDLGIRRRSVDHATATVSITATTDEARLQDAVNVTLGRQAPPFASIYGVAVLALASIGAAPRLEDGVLDVNFPDETVCSWDPGVSAWDYVVPLLAATNRRLWCDETGTWWISVPNTTHGAAVAFDETNAVQLVDDVSRDTDWYDGVAITWRWRSDAGVEQVAYESAGGPSPSRVLAVTYDRPFPGAGAAESLLARTSQRGRLIEVESVADPELSPRAPLEVDLGADGEHEGFIVRVEWAFNSDRTRVRSRDITED